MTLREGEAEMIIGTVVVAARWTPYFASGREKERQKQTNTQLSYILVFHATKAKYVHE